MRGARFGAASGLLVYPRPGLPPGLSSGFPGVSPRAIIQRPFRPPVGAKDFVLAFAGIPQASIDLPWPLQQCCKRQPTRRGICNNVANINQRSVAFATLLQASTDPPWYLQQCCKHQPTRRGFCNNVANVNRPAVAFATLLQRHAEYKRLSFSYVGLTSTINHHLSAPNSSRRRRMSAILRSRSQE